LDESPQGKAAKDADEAVSKEQERLVKLCGADFSLGYDQAVSSPTYQELICVAKPPDKPVDPKPTADAKPPAKGAK